MKVLEIGTLYCEIRDYTAKFREINKSISRKNAKFWQNPSAEFRGIPPKFREKNVLFRPISYFAKWPDTHFVATLPVGGEQNYREVPVGLSQMFYTA